jgi:hypothetical protein
LNGKSTLLDYLLARAIALACVGENYWPYIWLARDAARLAEEKN